MIERFCDRLVNWGIKRSILEEEKREIYVYASDLIVSSVLTKAILLIIALAIGQLPAALAYLIAAYPLRRYGGGWHAPKHFICILAQCASFIIVVALAMFLPKPYLQAACASSCILLIATVLCVAPVDNPNNPFSSDVKRRAKIICSVWSFIVSVTSALLLLFDHSYIGSIIALSMAPVVVSLIIPTLAEEGGESHEEDREKHRGQNA